MEDAHIEGDRPRFVNAGGSLEIGEAGFAEADVRGGRGAVAAEDDMVKDLDADDFAGFDELAGGGDVLGGGGGVAGGVVVGDDDGGGGQADGFAEDFARVGEAGVEDAAGDFDGGAAEAVFLVEGEHPDDFLVEAGGVGCEQIEDLGGFADEGGEGGVLAGGAPAEFKGGAELKGLDGADALDGDEVVVGGLGEAGEGSVVTVEDLAGEIDDALSADAGAQEDGDKDFVGDVFDAGVEGEFAGAPVAGEVADARQGDFVGARRFFQRGFHGCQHRVRAAA